jgi:hypothetical protein
MAMADEVDVCSDVLEHQRDQGGEAALGKWRSACTHTCSRHTLFNLVRISTNIKACTDNVS